MPADTTPSYADILAARQRVYRFLQPTPLHHYAGLDALTDAEIRVKHENHQPVGAFKVRGGVNLVAGMDAATRQRGLFTASTGNHGQSIAFAARAHGLQATVVVPEDANPGKVAAMRGLGAEVLLHGRDFDQSRQYAGQLAEESGGCFVGPTDAPLIAGVGTYALEILQQWPEVEVILVPVGAGSGACGTAIVAKTVRPEIQVIGVQSAQAPAMQQAWKSGRLAEGEMHTIAEGLATRVPFENTQRIMRALLDDFVLVSDAALQQAVLHYLQHTHQLVEEAGAAALAAAIQLKERLAGRKVAVIASGGNLSLHNLRTILKGKD